MLLYYRYIKIVHAYAWTRGMPVFVSLPVSVIIIQTASYKLNELCGTVTSHQQSILLDTKPNYIFMFTSLLSNKFEILRVVLLFL